MHTTPITTVSTPPHRKADARGDAAVCFRYVSGYEKMKTLLFCLLLSLGNQTLKADNVILLDTIANWSISYNDQVIIRGNETGEINQLKKVVRLKSPQDELTIHYRYDAVKPQSRTITIRQKDVVVYQSIQHLKDNHPSTILMKELMQKLKSKVTLLTIYYADDITNGKERMIGKIEIEK